MTVPRIYTNQPLRPHHSITLEPEPSHHLVQVLRLKTDARLRLFNGDGREYAGTIAQLTKKQLKVDIGEGLGDEPCPSLRINLIIGISRGERMDYALQKAVELGVTGIQPIFTRRCVVKLQGNRLQHRLQHWRRIVISACEQSGRCRLPELLPPQEHAVIMRTPPPGIGLLLDHRGSQSLQQLPRPESGVTLLIGPEGGLTEEERSLTSQRGYQSIRLGPRILRTETAPLAAIAAIQTLWGDFQASGDPTGIKN